MPEHFTMTQAEHEEAVADYFAKMGMSAHEGIMATIELPANAVTQVAVAPKAASKTQVPAIEVLAALAKKLRSQKSAVFADYADIDKFQKWSDIFIMGFPEEHRATAWTLAGVTFNATLEMSAQALEAADHEN